MKFSKNISVIAAGAALVAGLAPSLAQADAVAQSILNVQDFTFRSGNSALGFSGVALPAGVLAATTTADAFAELNGSVDNGSAIAGGRRADVGNVAFYTPGSFIAGAPTAAYVGSNAVQTGNAVFGSSTAKVDNTVSLKPDGDGTAQGNVNLNADYTLSIANAGTKLEVRFDAESWLRAYLDNNGEATASTSWVMTIRNSAGATVFRWTPDGILGSGISGGTEYADAFAMTDTVSRLTAGNQQVVNALGNFEAETNGLAAGLYNLSIRHTGNADAQVLPEPGSMALLSVALFGAGFAARRRAKK